jgi:GTP-binding protein
VKIASAIYISSNSTYTKCPAPDKPEFAFIGRSNVGKSSLINMLCGVHNLARISARPGKTQIINHFVINGSWYLVDLPGYGYAKVSKTMRDGFEKMISGYILGRTNLICVFVLIDIRIPPQELDLTFMANLSESNMPFCMVFTKADKLSKTAAAKAVAAYQAHMRNEWDELPEHFVTSAEKGTGRDELLGFIAENSKLMPHVQ